jgi:hypothetical protein
MAFPCQTTGTATRARQGQHMHGIKPILNLMALAWWKFTTYGMDPLSPYTARAVIRINELERK